jgi:Family of unknown function (DUF5906)
MHEQDRMSKIKSLNDIDAVRRYLNRIGAEPRSLKTAVVRENHGQYWRDLAVVRFDATGNATCDRDDWLPTPQEQNAILADWARVKFPQLKLVKRLEKLPKKLAAVSKEHLFEYRNAEGMIVMVQARVEIKGERAYLPWTYWDDDTWRNCEPDGLLPLFNADRLKNEAAVFIHEGAKAAKYWQRLIDGKILADRQELAKHPWAQELSSAVHLGWTGGAMSPQRTDWKVIKASGVKCVYIVADNDDPGTSAIAKIAKEIRLPCFAIRFSELFPASFDLADPFPKEMFAGEVYVGPTIFDCLHPATWITDLVETGQKGRPAAVLRDSARNQWTYVEENELFVCTQMPFMIHSEESLNSVLAPYSHVANPARLIEKEVSAHVRRFAYRPDLVNRADLVRREIIDRGHRAINLYVPSPIAVREGDASPWLDFLAYLFPIEAERKEMERWCATLIARPEIRIGYSLLLISERQGIGKTTLSNLILAPLVGYDNVSYPGETDILSEFNDWMARKRLVIVAEVHQGSSWKSYQRLKSLVTDKEITVNAKFQHRYTIDNWCHMIACSNSKRALKIEADDRRWFAPEMNEEPWPRAKFTELRSWLNQGGLSIVKGWAEDYEDYLDGASQSPQTQTKDDIIEGSMSQAQSEAVNVATTMADEPGPVAILMSDLRGYVKRNSDEKMFDNDYELRKVMLKRGVKQYEPRLKVAGKREYVLYNMALSSELEKLYGASEKHELVRKHLKLVEALMNATDRLIG